ncbi:MAG: hypothetical protein AAB214_06900 [Fibrobacterota bacterium]
MTTYTIILFLHNIVRWAVLGAGAYAIFRAVTGLLAKGGWLPADDKARKIFPITLDIQVVLGSLLAFVSPITQMAYSNMGAAMADKTLRFYAVEHAFIAVAAIALAHIGSAKIRRIKESRKKFQMLLTFHGLAMVLLVSRIPWDRPFFRVP